MTDVYLYPGEASPNDVKLSDPTVLRGGVTVTVDVAASIAAPVVAFNASHGVAVDLVASVPAPVVSLTASHGVAVALTASVPAPAVALSAALGNAVAITASVAAPTVAASVAHGVAVAIAAAVPAPVAAVSVAHGVAAAIAASVPAPVVALNAAHGIAVAIASSIPAPTVALSAAHGVAVAITANVGAPIVALGAVHGVAVAVAAAVPAPSSAISAAHGVAGSISSSVSAPVVALVESHGVSVAVTAIAAAPTVAFSAAHGVAAQLAALVPAPIVALVLQHDANRDGYYDDETVYRAPVLELTASVPSPTSLVQVAHGIGVGVTSVVSSPAPAMNATSSDPEGTVSVAITALVDAPSVDLVTTMIAPAVRELEPEGGGGELIPRTSRAHLWISASIDGPRVRMKATSGYALELSSEVDAPSSRVTVSFARPSYGLQVITPRLEVRNQPTTDTVFNVTTPQRVHRIDQGTAAGKPQKLPNGWLRVDGLLTKTGVFTYFNADGSKRRELRLDSEVFTAEALNSFGMVPVTDEHPPDFLDATNTREFSRGSVGELPKRDGVHVAAPLLVTDADLIKKLEAGEARELSCGYTCDLDFTAGTTADGQQYDAIQRKIRGNHVAVVARGRAGSSARVRMDSAGIAVVRTDTEPGGQPATPPHNQEPTVTVKIIRIDGVDYEAGSDAFSQAFARMQARSDDEKKAALDQASKLQGKLDAQAEEMKKLREDVAGMPKKLAAAAKVRADLESSARKVLGSKAKLDALDDTNVRILVLDKLEVKLPETKLKDEVYVTARFDAALESFDASEDEGEPAVSRARRNLEPVDRDDGDDNVDDEGEDGEESSSDEGEQRERRPSAERADTARAKMIKEAGQAWQKNAKRHGVDIG